MSTTPAPTIVTSVNALTTWGESGNISVSIKNGYPRFTFFFREDRKKFISAPMDIKTFGVVGYLIKFLSTSKEDKKYSLSCFNNDIETKQKILQSVLVLAKIGGEIYIGIKKDHNAPANLTKLETSSFITLSEDDKEPSNALLLEMVAKSYSDIIMGIVLNYQQPTDNVPNSKRANQSSKPDGQTDYSNVGL